MLVICVGIQDELFWIIPGNILMELSSLSIGKFKSKWNKYLVDKKKLSTKINFYINTINLDYKLFKYWNIPKAEKVKKEKENFYNIKELFPYKLLRPMIEQTHVDSYFYIQNIKFRIQHKTASERKVKSGAQRGQITCTIAKHKGRGKCGPYNCNDFDLLLIQINNFNEIIVLIPIQELIKRNYVSTKEKQGKVGLNFPLENVKCSKFHKSINKWIIKNYYFDLKKDINKLIILINKLYLCKKNNTNYICVDDYLEYR